MRLGYVHLSEEGDTNRLLDSVARRLQERGIRTAGTVQIDSLRPGRKKADMDLRLLPDGPVVRISLDRGDGAAGCRLDAAALEEAAAIVALRLDEAQALIVNKFGKQEASGHGLADSVAEALSRGTPVVVGMADHFLEGFLAYAGGCAVKLPGEEEAVLDWIAQAQTPSP